MTEQDKEILKSEYKAIESTHEDMVYKMENQYHDMDFQESDFGSMREIIRSYALFVEGIKNIITKD